MMMKCCIASYCYMQKMRVVFDFTTYFHRTAATDNSRNGSNTLEVVNNKTRSDIFISYTTMLCNL